MSFIVWDYPYDWTLPSFLPAAEENSSCTKHGCQCSLHYGYGPDLVEETALNEKYCTSVLSKLITEADAEIVELERELLLLQEDLARTNEGASDSSTDDLREKINFLDISIRELREKQDDHDFDYILKKHKEPAEKRRDILKFLLSRYFQKQDAQNAESCYSDHSNEKGRPSAPESNTTSEKLARKSLDASRPISKFFVRREKKRLDVGRDVNTVSLEPRGRGFIKSEAADTKLDCSPPVMKEENGEYKEVDRWLKVSPEIRFNLNTPFDNGQKRIIPTAVERPTLSKPLDSEVMAADTLLNLFDNRRDKGKSGTKESKKQPLKQVMNTDLASKDKWFNPTFSKKPRSKRVKRNCNSWIAQEPSLVLSLSSSSTTRYRGPLNSGLSKEDELDQFWAEELVAQSQKRIKFSLSGPDLLEETELKNVDISLAKLHGDSMNPVSVEDLFVTNCLSLNACMVEKCGIFDANSLATVNFEAN